jgi:hypothetical protein
MAMPQFPYYLGACHRHGRGVTDRVHRSSGFPRDYLRTAVNHLPGCGDGPSIVV